MEKEDFRALFTAALVALAASACSARAGGINLHLEAGQCEYARATDGTFYQSNLQTNNFLSPGCYSLGISGQFKQKPSWGWKVAYHDFGTIRAKTNVVTQRDEDAFQTWDQCDPETKRGCKATMGGEGKNIGLSIALTKRVPLRGFDVITEGGLLFFRSEFHAYGCAWDTGNVTYVNEHSPFSRLPALMGGIGVEKDNVYAMVRGFYSLGHREQSLTKHSVAQLVLGLRF